MKTTFKTDIPHVELLVKNLEKKLFPTLGFEPTFVFFIWVQILLSSQCSYPSHCASSLCCFVSYIKLRNSESVTPQIFALFENDITFDCDQIFWMGFQCTLASSFHDMFCWCETQDTSNKVSTGWHIKWCKIVESSTNLHFCKNNFFSFFVIES